jgi:hypothetical protein
MLKNEGYIFTIFGSIIVSIIICIFYLKYKINKKLRLKQKTIVYPIPIIVVQRSTDTFIYSDS